MAILNAARLEDEPPKRAPQANMRWLLGYIGRHRAAALLSVVCGVGGGITAAFEPFLIGVIIDHVLSGYTPEQLLPDLALLVGLAILTVIFFWAQRLFSGQVAYSVNYDIRRDLFDNLVTLEHAFYQRSATGDLISRMYTDIDAIWRLMMISFMRFGSAITSVVITFALLAAVDVTLTILAFVVLTISTGFQVKAGMALAPMFERVQDQAGNVSSFVQDITSGIQTVKTFGKEDAVIERFRAENTEMRRRWLFFKRRYEPVGMLPNAISQLVAGVVVLFGGIMAINGTITLGNFTQFLLYLATISSWLLQLGMIYQRYQQARGALTRITPMLQDAVITTPAHPRELARIDVAITFEHVSVQLDGKWLLHDVNLHIPAGAVVALVGATGAGKTLLVNLLARVLDPTKGRVLIDGVDVRDLDLDALRRAIAYVPQTTFLFSDTLRENVRMGRPDLSDEEFERALVISRVSNDLEQLPDGIETLVGEKGVMLSGGQKQRVAIARALARDPALLVLDDALSSVDTHTAADILVGLRGVLRTRGSARGRTSLIIAHRIATVKDADLVVLIDQGRIIAQGTHEELLAQGGAYTAMVERELKGDGDAHGADEPHAAEYTAK